MGCSGDAVAGVIVEGGSLLRADAAQRRRCDPDDGQSVIVRRREVDGRMELQKLMVHMLLRIYWQGVGWPSPNIRHRCRTGFLLDGSAGSFSVG